MTHLMQSTGISLFNPKRNLARARSSSGVALLIVLALLVLLTGLVMAFFTSATTELASAKSYAGGSSSQQLADAATQLAIGSIRKATSEVSDTSSSGTDIAWASQPGMIRTWDNKGNPRNIYKLFSAANLETKPPYDATSATDGPDLDTDFDQKPALFTDLNAPVSGSGGAVHYPIVDPTLSASKTGPDPKIAGFYVTNPPTAVKVPNRAPMPVRWIYVLQDGKLLVPDPAGDGKTADFTGAVKPTPKNPIVGRIAYWTDDDTSKVNINTASEGVYWDMPRIMSVEDTGRWSGSGDTPTKAGLAVTQPASGEYQRYPGHPATTSLSPIFGKQGIGPLATPDPTTLLTSGNISSFKTYYDLIPRISVGGSYSGTKIPNPNPGAGSNPNAGKINPDNDRLFASVDEFMFMQPSANASGGRQIVPPLTATDLKLPLERSRFFLTAHSSAPEVTIFNTPRVSMWPVWDDETKRTVLDSTLAFCANLKVNDQNTPYYFTRRNSRSMTDDYLLSARNQQLYAYLDRMMKTEVPGFGGKFSDTAVLGTDQPQVLTSIYDYIRCINLYDVSTENGSTAKPYTKLVRMGGSTQNNWGGGEILPIKINNTQGFGRYATLSGIDLIFGAGPSNPVDMTKVTVAQVMLVPTFFSPMQGLPGMYPKIKYTITADPGTFTLDGEPIFQAGGGITGTSWITNAPVQQTEGRGMGGMISPRASLERYGEFVTPFYKQFRHGASTLPRDPPDSFNSGEYPFISYNSGTSTYKTTPNIALSPLNPAFPQVLPPMKLHGGLLTVTVSSADQVSEVIQTFYVNIPDDDSISRPRYFIDNNGLFRPIINNNGVTSARETNKPGDPPKQVTAVDSVRGVEVGGPGDIETDTSNASNTSAGDIRMIAALPTVPARYFHAHKDWSRQAQASGLMDDDGVNRNFVINDDEIPTPSDVPKSTGRHGALAKGMNPRGKTGPAYGRRSPYVPSRAFTGSLSGVTRTNGDSSALGDWDAGYAFLPDGAYLNMGDIGDQAYVDRVNNAYNNFDNPNGVPRSPYVVKEDHFNSDVGAGTYFSPNRQVPSSMVLGSIPTGVKRFQPWQTLLFNPKPEDPNHPGRGVRGSIPPDHLIADLFWMPVVSPYPISQPFSTAGKINLNYQIQPFTYIERSTGIYALMKATKMMAMPPLIYRSSDPKPFLGDVPELNRRLSVTDTFRLPINVKETLKGFEKVFTGDATNPPDIFRSASQISEINLVPDNGSATYDRMRDFWLINTVTGDNLREKPYVDLYPRLTTKSNSYTVHFRVQVLQKLPGTPVAQWVEGRDQVGSEYRGSSEIERYLDSSDSKLPDYAALMASNPSDAALNLDNHYRYRIVSTKRFSPY